MNQKVFFTILQFFYYGLSAVCGVWMMICLHFDFTKEAFEFVALSFFSVVLAELFKNIRKKLP